MLCSSHFFRASLGATKNWLEQTARDGILAVRKYAWHRIGDHTAAEQRATIRLFEAARLFNFTYVKQHELDAADIDILQEVFPFVTPTALLQLVVENDQYNIAAS